MRTHDGLDSICMLCVPHKAICSLLVQLHLEYLAKSCMYDSTKTKQQVQPIHVLSVLAGFQDAIITQPVYYDI